MSQAINLDAKLLDLMLRAGSRWVLWLLLGLSVVALAVMFERLWFFATARQPKHVVDGMLAALRTQGAQAALALVREAKSMEAAVARAALAPGAGVIEEQIAATLDEERLRYERGLGFLGTLGNNAPFVGLFGTVLGIIRAFHDLAANTALGSQAVMAGIAEALVATGVGLLVALPAVAVYNLFTRHVESRVAAAGALGHRLLAVLKAERQ